MNTKVYVRLDTKTHSAVLKQATQYGLTIASYLRLAIKYAVEHFRPFNS